MMKRMMQRGLVAGIVLSMCLAGTSHADRRSYVWTYEYSTMPAGIAEAEYYLTAKVPDAGAEETSTWQHQVEIEYGLTDNWDISMYQMWAQSYGTNSTSEFDYEGFKIRSRYKLFQAGRFFVDPLLYLEYIRNANLGEPDVLEGKLVLARDIGDFNVAYNQIVERAFDADADLVHEYAAGASYDFLEAFSAGLEVKGSYSEDEHAAGPVVSVETDNLWVTLGAAFGLNQATDDVQARLIAGFSF